MTSGLATTGLKHVENPSYLSFNLDHYAHFSIQSPQSPGEPSYGDVRLLSIKSLLMMKTLYFILDFISEYGRIVFRKGQYYG